MAVETIRSGLLDQRITIYRKSGTSQNSFGQETPTLVVFMTVWASVEPLRGEELRASMREVAAEWATITIRYDRSHIPDTTMTLYHTFPSGAPGPTIYDIRAVTHVGTGRRKVELTCRVIR